MVLRAEQEGHAVAVDPGQIERGPEFGVGFGCRGLTGLPDFCLPEVNAPERGDGSQVRSFRTGEDAVIPGVHDQRNLVGIGPVGQDEAGVFGPVRSDVGDGKAIGGKTEGPQGEILGKSEVFAVAAIGRQDFQRGRPVTFPVPLGIPAESVEKHIHFFQLLHIRCLAALPHQVVPGQKTPLQRLAPIRPGFREDSIARGCFLITFGDGDEAETDQGKKDCLCERFHKETRSLGGKGSQQPADDERPRQRNGCGLPEAFRVRRRESGLRNIDAILQDYTSGEGDADSRRQCVSTPNFIMLLFGRYLVAFRPNLQVS